ncbi:MAG: YjzC family protein [Phycisphaeraceae bacterium]|nr:YjzC family protein [Phycisphaeraceae bacterium]
MPAGTRFKTGEKSPEKTAFNFDGYLDGTSHPAPTQEERVISLDKGETFPPIRSANKACWWKQMR